MAEELFRDVQILDLRQKEMLDIVQGEADQRRSVMEHTVEGFLHSGNNKDKNIQARSQLSRTLGVSQESDLPGMIAHTYKLNNQKTEV